MNRAEFMRRLTELLGDVSPMERDEAIQYYNDYFDDAGEENEGGVISSLGTPEELARSIKAGLNDSGNGGEFTESGFSGYTQAPKDEMIRAEDAGTNGHSDNSAGGMNGTYNDNRQYGGAQNGNGYYEGAYYRRPEGDGIYGGRKDTRAYHNPYEQNNAQNYGTYGQSGPQNTAYGQDNSQDTTYGRDGSQDTTYGQNSTHETSYGQGSGGAQNTAYGQANTQDAPYGQSAPGKEKMSGGMIALLVILAVFTSPIWLGLLGGFFGLAVGVIATLFALFLTFLIIGVVFIAVSFALLVTGISLLFSTPAGGVCVLGCAFVLFAAGLLFAWLMIVMAGMAIPACIRGIVSLCQKIFHRGGARA